MLVERKEISASKALEIVRFAIDHASENGWEVCAAICDPRGALAALARTDNVVVPAIDFAIDKAYTAATLQRSTQDFHKRAESRPALKLGLANRPRILVFPGGLPLIFSGTAIGGLGVSGAQDHEDVECAIAAIEKAGLTTKP
jgi:uncharacterized protein GlcG (DUF336 family)